MLQFTLQEQLWKISYFFTDEKNFHEILTVGDKPAAFFDILAPPYHTETEEDEIRECYFFSELNVGSNNNNIHSDSPIMWLRRIKCPNDYVSHTNLLYFTEYLVLDFHFTFLFQDCDSEPYLGPAIWI